MNRLPRVFDGLYCLVHAPQIYIMAAQEVAQWIRPGESFWIESIKFGDAGYTVEYNVGSRVRLSKREPRGACVTGLLPETSKMVSSFLRSQEGS